MLSGLHFLGKMGQSGSLRHIRIPTSLAIKIIGPGQEGSLCLHTRSSGKGWVLSKLHVLYPISLPCLCVHSSILAIENGSVAPWLISSSVSFFSLKINGQPLLIAVFLQVQWYGYQYSPPLWGYPGGKPSFVDSMLKWFARCLASKSFSNIGFMFYSWIWCGVRKSVGKAHKCPRPSGIVHILIGLANCFKRILALILGNSRVICAFFFHQGQGCIFSWNYIVIFKSIFCKMTNDWPNYSKSTDLSNFNYIFTHFFPYILRFFLG